MKILTAFRPFPNTYLAILALSLLTSLSLKRGMGSDWPQLLGPNRSGHASDSEPVPQSLPSPNSKPLWELACGEGFAGVAVADNQVAFFDRDGKNERLRLLAAETGKLIWTCPLFGSTYRGSVNPDSGPRCVPIILPDRILVYGVSGDLSCVNRDNGKILWTRPLRKEYQADDGYFGAGNTPVVVDELAIINVGGKKQGGIVAVNLQSGKTAWAVTDVGACYASPIVLSGEPKTVLVPTQLSSIGIDPKSGSIRFQVPFGQRGTSAVAATPIQLPNGNVFLTATYGTDACLFTPKSNSAEIIYAKDPIFRSQFATPVTFDNFVLGSDGREDFHTGSYKCIDVTSRKLLWENKSIGIAHTIAIKNRLLIIDIEGHITLADASATELQIIAKFDLPNGIYRSLPAFSNGRLFIRNQTDSLGRLLVYQL